MGMKKRDHSESQKGGGKVGKKRRTTAQRRTQQSMTQFSQGWNERLTEDQRIAWRRLAEALPRRVRNGRFYRTDPPPQPKFGVNPKVALKIAVASNRLSLKLAVSEAPTEDIMVFASPPWKAGRTYCGDYRFLCLLPAPVKGWSDITRQYIEKFGVPPPNTRVFIRTWQQVDGWENRGQMKLTNALVPRP